MKNGTVAGYEWNVHHRQDPRRDQVVHAGGHRQARREDHAQWQARAACPISVQGDNLSATIITSRPPTIMTQQQVDATLAAAAAPAAPPPAAAAPAPRARGATTREPAGIRRPRRGATSAPRTLPTYRQFVADARAREHRVTRDGAHADDRAPLRPVGSSCCCRDRVRASTRERGHRLDRPPSDADRRSGMVLPRPSRSLTSSQSSTARRDDVRNGVSVWCFRISGGGEGRCSASSSSEFFRFSRLVRA